MVLMVRLVVLMIKIFVAYVKVSIFFAKHDDDMLGDIANGVLSDLWAEYDQYKAALQ